MLLRICGNIATPLMFLLHIRLAAGSTPICESYSPCTGDAGSECIYSPGSECYDSGGFVYCCIIPVETTTSTTTSTTTTSTTTTTTTTTRAPTTRTTTTTRAPTTPTTTPRPTFAQTTAKVGVTVPSATTAFTLPPMPSLPTLPPLPPIVLPPATADCRDLVPCCPTDPISCSMCAQRIVNCALSCGLCRPVGCVDTDDLCPTLLSACDKLVVQQVCPNTCRMCGPVSGITERYTLLPPGASGGCADFHYNCADWGRNGFCTNTFYSNDVRAEYCPKTCGLC